jgi:outer membrane protein
VRILTTIRPVTGAALLALAAGVAAQGQTAATGPSNSKVAVIEIQAAIFQTKDGQKALADLQAKFNPVKAKLEAKRAEIAKNEETLRKGANTMAEEARAKLARDVDVQTKALNRDTDDANADLEQENQKIMNELGSKMMAIINKYANEKGYLLVLDVSAQNTPVLWASNTIDITRDVIAAYDSGAASLPATSPGSAPAPVSKVPAPAPRIPASSSGIKK